MKLKDFKQSLKDVGASYNDLRRDAITNEWHIEEFVKDKKLPSQVISVLTIYNDSTKYWMYIRNALIKQETIDDKILSDFKICQCGNDWVIGCQVINKNKRLKLFKLLAKDLGYEIKGE